jgi:ATP-dependent DNA helicase MPH1
VCAREYEIWTLTVVYRWFPTGKIVFLAPTKPLVNQQIEACQMSCGIPSASAAVMTGSSIPAAQRAKLWDAKRVFYCTPQTLDNDLKNGSVDPRDIVLAVFGAYRDRGEELYLTRRRSAQGVGALCVHDHLGIYHRTEPILSRPGSDGYAG